MQVDIDMSGKLHRMGEPTVLALANGISYSIRIAGQEKVLVQAELVRRRPRMTKTRRYVLTFATLLYLLLEEHVDQLDHITVDVEFEGYEALVREHVRNLFARQGVWLEKDRITLRRIGKKSPAHKLAWSVFNQLVEPDREVTAGEVLAEFRQK